MKSKETIDKRTITFSGGAVIVPIYGTFLIVVELARKVLDAITQLQEGVVDRFFWILIALICVSLVYMALTATYTSSRPQSTVDKVESDTHETQASTGVNHQFIGLSAILALLMLLSLSSIGQTIAQTTVTLTGSFAVVALCGILLIGLSVIKWTLQLVMKGPSLVNKLKRSSQHKGDDS